MSLERATLNYVHYCDSSYDVDKYSESSYESTVIILKINRFVVSANLQEVAKSRWFCSVKHKITLKLRTRIGFIVALCQCIHSFVRSEVS